MDMNKEALAEFEKITLLLDYSGNDEQNKYILGILAEIKRRIINDGDYEYLKNRTDITAQSDITYSGGKVLSSMQKDFKVKEMLKCTYNK